MSDMAVNTTNVRYHLHTVCNICQIRHYVQHCRSDVTLYTTWYVGCCATYNMTWRYVQYGIQDTALYTT